MAFELKLLNVVHETVPHVCDDASLLAKRKLWLQGNNVSPVLSPEFACKSLYQLVHNPHPSAQVGQMLN